MRREAADMGLVIGLVEQHLLAVHRLPFRPSSVISRPFIARLIKGCRVDARADCFFLLNNRALSTL
jgi:hypothetical protein